MKKLLFIIVGLVIVLINHVAGQNTDASNTVKSSKLQVVVPEIPTEFSITKYKNIDFLKINPLQLQSAGQHNEIYISNTNHGVIIISSTEYDKVLKDFSHILELNSNYYETITRQDTSIFLSGNNKNPAFDFSKISSINHDYKNAFNYSIDPRTGVSWSKGNYDEINVRGGKGYGQLLYDLIILAPKTIK